jgi:hypothetical protein
MDSETKEAVRQVLLEAGSAPNFFDLSDAERLNWMIGRGYELGRQRKPLKPYRWRRKARSRATKREAQWKIKKIVFVK